MKDYILELLADEFLSLKNISFEKKKIFFKEIIFENEKLIRQSSKM